MKPNEFGVRMATLDEMKYKKELWNHRPLTDFGEWERIRQKLEEMVCLQWVM